MRFAVWLPQTPAKGLTLGGCCLSSKNSARPGYLTEPFLRDSHPARFPICPAELAQTVREQMVAGYFSRTEMS